MDRSRFTFPPINMSSPIEPQLTYRAEWVGYRLIRMESADAGVRWKLVRKANSFVFDSLCEVEMKLVALLEEIGERVRREQLARLVAERAVLRQVAEAPSTVVAA